ncbi:MAG: hypothetical protein KDA22_09015 [Phycisphaerales bacterium]|nr:hypothetical protein [Phycisphaerales bacterium]
MKNTLKLLLAAATSVALAACESPPKKETQNEAKVTVAADDPLLKLDFEQFDQTPGSGWRLLASAERFAEAGAVIDAYLQRHAELTPGQRQILSFHAGQVYAFGGDYTRARERFRASITPNEPKDAPIRWNAYVSATIAFLENDKAGLIYARGLIQDGPAINGVKPNLNFVDSFLENLGLPYSVAYRRAKPPVPEGTAPEGNVAEPVPAAGPS